MKILQINSVYAVGSTGRIASDIHNEVSKLGEELITVYGRGTNKAIDSVKISNLIGFYSHIILTRLFDTHGLHSKMSTKKIIHLISDFQPDIVHLHNLHGYYLNYELIFKYLKKTKIKVIWTLHDCWSFTGHCAYYTYEKCTKWKIGCEKCPQKKNYPSSLIFDNSSDNYRRKKELYSDFDNLILVTPSSWLKNEVSQSFMRNLPVTIINNGINTDIFKYNGKSKQSKTIDLLGVANVWDSRKGLIFFLKLSKILTKDYRIILIGIDNKKLEKEYPNIITIPKTNNINDLVEYYNNADIFINPTLEDNFPTTNIEALACGTPVITFNTGGSGECINMNNGRITKEKNEQAILDEIKYIIDNKTKYNRLEISEFAHDKYSKSKMSTSYYDLYKSVINDYNQESI